MELIKRSDKSQTAKLANSLIDNYLTTGENAELNVSESMKSSIQQAIQKNDNQKEDDEIIRYSYTICLSQFIS